MKLLAEALIKFTCGLLLVGLLLFLPAGTITYPYGWLLIGLLFVPMLIAGFVMLAKSPDFLKKRLDAKEKQGTQRAASHRDLYAPNRIFFPKYCNKIPRQASALPWNFFLSCEKISRFGVLRSFE
ncbi:MAG: hypothetical protein E7453_09110 [Ruminococcaceae bacterium]|nr:hypothetical protein [Oscillospiraceae bacterium]